MKNKVLGLAILMGSCAIVVAKEASKIDAAALGQDTVLAGKEGPAVPKTDVPTPPVVPQAPMPKEVPSMPEEPAFVSETPVGFGESMPEGMPDMASQSAYTPEEIVPVAEPVVPSVSQSAALPQSLTEKTAIGGVPSDIQSLVKELADKVTSQLVQKIKEDLEKRLHQVINDTLGKKV